jgi:HD superfamily phosphohydrolase
MSDLPRPLEPFNPVQDPVHGRIWLTRLEVDLIDTPEFQRLRWISQLAPADQVFPGSTHTRFAHSIGAAHVMGLILRQTSIQTYFQTTAEHLIPLLRLAALLHDIGHLPFSHVGEMAWAYASSARAFDYVDTDGQTVFDAAARARPRPPLHEDLSVLIIRHSQIGQLIDDAIQPVDQVPASELVAKLIDGSHPDLVARNLLSSDLDCDRLDYLLRDSMAAGLPYGRIDLEYLVGHLVICEHEKSGPTLALEDPHGRLAGEHFLMARYYHYAQFIGHKTIAAAEINVVAALLELIRCEAIPSPQQLLRGEEAARLKILGKLTDPRLLTQIAEAPERHRENEDLVEASARLFNRRLAKTAARHDDLEEIPRRLEGRGHRWDAIFAKPTTKEDAARECDVDPKRFFYRWTSMAISGMEGDVTPTKAYLESETVDQGWRKAVKLGKHGQAPELLVERSGPLRHLSGQRWATRRIFFRQSLTGEGAADEDQEQRLRIASYFQGLLIE